MCRYSHANYAFPFEAGTVKNIFQFFHRHCQKCAAILMQTMLFHLKQALSKNIFQFLNSYCYQFKVECRGSIILFLNKKNHEWNLRKKFTSATRAMGRRWRQIFPHISALNEAKRVLLLLLWQNGTYKHCLDDFLQHYRRKLLSTAPEEKCTTVIFII